METRPVARRISALILVVTVSVVGMAFPAAGQEDVEVARHRALTINGRPLSQFLNATLTTGGTVGLTGPLEQENGQISGVALDGDGQPATGKTVQLRHVRPPTEVVDRTTTDANGRFSFAALGSGRYIVDLRIAGKVVATSGLISLAEGGMTFTRVGGIPTQQPPTDDGKGRRVLTWTAVGAGVGGAFGLVALAGVDCDLSENLCPLPPLMGTILGALGGLMFGLGR